MIRSAGGFASVIELCDTAIAMSGRDSMRLPMAYCLVDIPCSVPFKSELFFALAKSYIETMRVNESIRFSKIKD